jgi:hypothetical protein
MSWCPSPCPNRCPGLRSSLSTGVQESQSFYACVREVLPDNALTLLRKYMEKTGSHWDAGTPKLRRKGGLQAAAGGHYREQNEVCALAITGGGLGAVAASDETAEVGVNEARLPGGKPA